MWVAWGEEEVVRTMEDLAVSGAAEGNGGTGAEDAGARV
jgi:hypothetical protein